MNNYSNTIVTIPKRNAAEMFQNDIKISKYEKGK